MAKASSKAAPSPRSPARLSHRQRLAWLRLIRSENIGPATFRALINEFAGEQGREVFAVPGSPLEPRADGTNNLLKQGACLVTSARDIVETLTPILGRACPASRRQARRLRSRANARSSSDIHASERELILEALGPSPVDIDELIRATRLPARKVYIVLLELDFAGRLQRHGQQLVSLTGA